MNMLVGLTAMGKTPKKAPRKKPVARPVILDRIKQEPKYFNLVKNELIKGVKTRTELLNKDLVAKSTLENIIAYMFALGLIEKIPLDRRNHRAGMSYKWLGDDKP